MSMDFGPRRDDRAYARPLDTKIVEMFGAHGKKVSAVLQQAALYPRGLHNMVLMLGGRIDTDADGMLAQILKYVERYGAEVFLTRIGAKKDEAPLAMSTTMAPKAEAKPASAPSPPVTTPDGYTPPEHFNASGKYCGPERRGAARSTRRKGPRRTECEAVDKNKRYGKDRRQRKRRKDDTLRQ